MNSGFFCLDRCVAPFLPILNGQSNGSFLGWAKFGKPIWSTRVIVHDMHPIWEETAFILVGPEETNADERLRLQLWDSDRTSADDDLGRIEVGLAELMHGAEYQRSMRNRSDGFKALEGSQVMPGTLDWAVGYFPKAKLQSEQISKQEVEPVDSVEELAKTVSQDIDKKLREAVVRDESMEKNQQKVQELKSREGVLSLHDCAYFQKLAKLITCRCHDCIHASFGRISDWHTRCTNS